MTRARLRLDWLLFLVWSLFVNVCNLWLIGPLVEDYSILGVIALFAIGAVWILSIPKQWRKTWIVFTLFSVFLGTGFDSLSFFPGAHRLEWMIIMAIVMMIAAYWYARVRLISMLLSAALLMVCNLWLPFEDWTFLTHFKVAFFGKAGLNPMDMPSLPIVVVPLQNGSHAVLTLSSLTETKTDVQSAVAAAGTSPNDLHNVIQSFNHRYSLVELSKNAHGFVMGSPNPSDLADASPLGLYSSFFPMNIAYWTLSPSGEMIQYTVPTLSPWESTQVSNDGGDYPANLLSMAQAVQSENQQHWQELLTKLGVGKAPGLYVDNNVLQGQWKGHSIQVPVHASAVIGLGSFTGPNKHEVLLEGANRLQVVDLSQGSGRLVSTYVGSLENPVSDDIRVGPIDNSGQDVVFVNQSPAFMLQATANGRWKTLYTAPAQSSLRFEGSAWFGTDKSPEIITDDPSYMRPTPIRFLSSYTYSDGQLERNWRVYRTNAVNVYPIQFSANGPTDLVLSIYNEGKFFVLSRHDIPVVPLTSGLLGLSVLIGFLLRIRKGGTQRGSNRPSVDA